MRGFTLLEILLVMGMILLLTSLLIGGFSDMAAARRIGNSLERVVNTISLARSHAIADNAITHIRIENTSAQQQFIGVYRFKKVGEAIRADTEQAVQDIGGWKSTADLAQLSAPAYNCQQIDKLKLEAGVFFETQYDPDQLCFPDSSSASTKNKFKPLSSVTRPNTLFYTGFAPYSGENILPRETAYPGPFPGAQKLLYFFPDGTASANVTILIRDEERFRWVQVWKGGVIRNGDLQNAEGFNQLK